MTLHDKTGRPITLSQKIGGGGEGDVHTILHDHTRVAKTYHHPTIEHHDKLLAMINKRPRNANDALAWPQELLYNASGNMVGFTMPRVTRSVTLAVVRNPTERRAQCPGCNYRHIVAISANTARLVHELHTHGYVIGDISSPNFLANNRGIVTLIDCDSIQVPRASGRGVHRCTVGGEPYTPPELHGIDLATIDRTEAHDRHSLAVLLFRLLNEGAHPFSGIYHGTEEPPPLPERVRRGLYAYNNNPLLSPALLAPPLDNLPVSVRRLCERAFTTGLQQPSARPTPQEWASALTTFQRALTTCNKNNNHAYGNHRTTCPWCEHERQHGYDPFPPQPTTIAPRATILTPGENMLVHNTTARPVLAPWQRAWHNLREQLFALDITDEQLHATTPQERLLLVERLNNLHQ